MLNTFYVAGRLVNEPILEENDTKYYTTIMLSVSRSYKNEEGIYENDILEITTYGKVASNLNEYCKQGDIIGAKGRIAKLPSSDKMTLIADKLTYLKRGDE